MLRSTVQRIMVQHPFVHNSSSHPATGGRGQIKSQIIIVWVSKIVYRFNLLGIGFSIRTIVKIIFAVIPTSR